jgi:hypothetical protein
MAPSTEERNQNAYLKTDDYPDAQETQFEDNNHTVYPDTDNFEEAELVVNPTTRNAYPEFNDYPVPNDELLEEEAEEERKYREMVDDAKWEDDPGFDPSLNEPPPTHKEAIKAMRSAFKVCKAFHRRSRHKGTPLAYRRYLRGQACNFAVFDRDKYNALIRCIRRNEKEIRTNIGMNDRVWPHINFTSGLDQIAAASCLTTRAPKFMVGKCEHVREGLKRKLVAIAEAHRDLTFDVYAVHNGRTVLPGDPKPNQTTLFD